MDILMVAGEKITGKIEDLEDWNNDEERAFWRGIKPTEEPFWVYLVRDGCIIGRIKYIDYRYEEGENLQNEIQKGGAFILKGPFIKPSKTIEVPKNILQICGGLWRYIENLPDEIRDEIKNKINESFKN